MCHGIDHWIAEYERERLEREELEADDSDEEADELLAPADD